MGEVICKLNKSFQKEIFERVIRKYGGSINSARYLKIPASSIRGYKNLYFSHVPKSLIDKLISYGVIKIGKTKKYTISTVNKSNLISNNLENGRKIRAKTLNKLKKDIPKISEILNLNRINIEKWFEKYLQLLNSGFRKISYSIEKDVILIEYFNFDGISNKKFKVSIPKKVNIDNEFVYFFGLWCGDRAGGKRIGICNQNKEILEFTDYFLKKHNQKIERILYISPSLKLPKIKYHKKYLTHDEIMGWCLSIHSVNGIFSSFFYYLQDNIYEFLNLIKNKEAFFAGLFDAEGNVSLYNKSFKWACKNEKLIKIYMNTLNNLSLKNTYDGSSIVCYDKINFLNKIFPLIKHSDKINKTKILCNLGGEPLEEHKKLLKFIKKYPQFNQKQIAKALKKKKVYSELMVLKEMDLISSTGYPHSYGITSKGLRSIGA